MPLFPSLSKTSTFADANDESSSSAHPPTVIQLHNEKSINFTNATITSHEQDFRPLTYHTTSDASLGIWNCHCQIENSLPMKLCQEITGQVLFLCTVDLDCLNDLQSILHSMLENIKGYVAASSHDSSPEGSSGSTLLSQLKQCTFGKAPLEESMDNLWNIPVKDGQDANVNICILCMLPKGNKEITYRDKQAINLISYHLQKYCSEINCTLAYLEPIQKVVEGDNEQEDESKVERKGDAFLPKGLTMKEFMKEIHSLCLGSNKEGENDQDITSQTEDQQEEGENDQDSSTLHTQVSIFRPYEYDVDLINSVLLRGAGCPGVWNANTDSLWNALPPTHQEKSDKVMDTVSEEASNGDHEWLQKLADSVSAYVGAAGSGKDDKSVRSTMDQTIKTTRTTATAATKKKVIRKKPRPSGGSEKEDNKDVQDFFAGLLNK
ncbi:hypothetical protein CTEN210_11586 [Chaetoceros tenuissimus]|uniref:Uncharacterized protein n=1 Tax=Chaetoceros tenuissimus TaxID=426638 RepID=A0AAD3D1S7_9STRA|nr:hypothetical protein CTEN210_11586 [Chaetoceros tenuissimus]